MQATVAVGIFCKTPGVGLSKTRLSPPLRPEQCAALSACFIQDLAQTIDGVTHDVHATGYAVYTPRGSEDALCKLLPSSFRLHPQCDGEFGVRVVTAMAKLLEQHAGAILVNADSPTLPASILRDAVNAVRSGDSVVLSPACDGGYTLIGLSRMREGLFADIPWSNAQVYGTTVARAAELGVPVVNVAGWYDVDDAASLQMLCSELAGKPPAFTQRRGAQAVATRAYLTKLSAHTAVRGAG